MIRRIGDKESDENHFFGFHDLVNTNYEETKILSLEINNISKPPYLNDEIKVGYFDKNSNSFVCVKKGKAFNYPQGARQQWIGKSNQFVFNDLVNDTWGSHIVDTDTNDIIQTNSFPIHCLDEVTGNAFYMNYARVHRVGGYGYVGLEDIKALDDIPSDCGIFVGNIKTSQKKILVSISDIANCNEESAVITGYPHYITHLCLNPAKDRIAFLHRYRLSDGGENTRLMTVDVTGSDLRCIAKGFLSHFTWLSNDKIFIWGQKSSGVSNLRESKLYNNKVFSLGIKLAKFFFRNFLSKSVNAINKKTFLHITDSNMPNALKIGEGILDEDGHPMLNPKYSDWLVNDTYPNGKGIRQLMLYNYKTNQKIVLGEFKMIDTKPDQTLFSVEKVHSGIDKRIKEKFPIDQYCFTRSGFHCDLHPRWSSDGHTVYFDSIHEGSRQIYAIEVSNHLKG
jgi:hypothetical protein